MPKPQKTIRNRPMKKVKIRDTHVAGTGEPLLVIAGPCQIESRDHCLKIASFLVEVCHDLPVNLVFKSSFDKANRTSLGGVRGPGMEEGLAILAEVGNETGLPLISDIHLPEQAAAAAEVLDILQIPAFLCRQTDLLLAAGKTGAAINLKKGQFLHPEDMQFGAEKIASTGNDRILLCERGTMHGYRDLVVDMRSLPLMQALGYPVVFDATHSVQSMGGSGGKSGGNRQFIVPLIRAAAATGIDGLFIECHDDPANAPSDGASMLPLEEVREAIAVACRIREAIG